MTAQDDKDLLERLVLDQRPGPAPRISSARANALVQAAMSDAYARGIKDEVLEEERARGAAPWPAPWLRAAAMAAAGLLMLVGGAAAAKLVIEAIWEAPPSEPAAIDAPPELPARKALSPEPVPDEIVLPEPEPEVLEIEAIEPSRRKPSARREDVEKITEDLLQAANRARAAGQFRDAADKYAEVYEQHPSTLSAYVAEVAAGSLELEHLDRPDRAVRLFRRALRTRPNGALDLEARQGLANALRDLGRSRDEIAVLRALVAAHPERPAALRAQARLNELRAALAP